MNEMAAALEQAVESWDERGWPRPQAMVVSGSGLAVDLGEPIAEPLPLAEILPFPVHRVEGHPLAIELLRPLPDRPVLYCRGRLHAYQGYDPHQVVFTVRFGALLGVKVLILSHAAGGIHPRLGPGGLHLVRDHLNLTGLNPLFGELPAAWGPRFPDMSAAYDPTLRRLLGDLGEQQELGMEEVVYAGLAGPSYETPAEIEMLRTLGADVCGMSTVLEVIAARHMGVRCACVSLVSNHAAGVSEGGLDHEEVLVAGRAAAGSFHRLLTAALAHPALLADAGSQPSA